MPDHQSAAEQHTNIKLPAGWEYAEHKKQQTLQAEYQLKLHAAHPLYGIDVVIIAYRESNDDILLQHIQQEDHVSVVHLTWAMKQQSTSYPRVQFSGSFQAFVQHEHLLYDQEED